MFDQLKRIFGRSSQAPRTESAPTAVGSRPNYSPRHTEPASASESAPSPDLNAEDVSIPLAAVLGNLPPDLKSCVVPMDLGGATLTVALHKVVPQLPSRMVKLSFGVLRGAAPQLFSIGDVWDQRDIELPLNELLVRIHPSLLPAAPGPEAGGNQDDLENSILLAAAPASPSRPGCGPMRVPLPATEAAPAVRTTTSVPAPVVAKTTPVTASREAITIPLSALSAAWPGTVRAEFAKFKCADSLVAFPEHLLQAKMKQGKVAFHWQTIRGWLQPAPPTTISKHDNTLLNLPLEVIMPLFVSRLKHSQRAPQPRVVVDETIPALFGPEANPDAPVTISDNSPNTATAAAAPAATKPKTPGTDFKNRYLSPLEAATRAASLDGVAGALLVLPEGLPVAAKISTNQDADTLAAFLARAFGRVNQCAEEATIGELSQLDFMVKGVPWQIYRLNGVLFAAFGWAGGTLPTPQLAALAGEFDRKK